MDGGAMTDQLPVYTVTVFREDDLWVAVVDGLAGGATDVEHFEDLPEAVSDLIATLVDADRQNFWIDWHYRQGNHELTEIIQDLRQWEKQAQLSSQNRDAARIAAVEAMRNAGLSYREIADAIGTSHQRIGQLLDQNLPHIASSLKDYRFGTATMDSQWTPELARKLRNVVVHGVRVSGDHEYLSPIEAALVSLLDSARQLSPSARQGLLSVTAEVLEEVAADEEFLRYG